MKKTSLTLCLLLISSFVFSQIKEYHDNGNLRLYAETNYAKKLDGTAKIYYPSGKLGVIAKFSNGVIIGKHKNYYENGQLNIERNYKKGKPVGKWVGYYETGEKKFQAIFNYRNEGLCTFYGKNGKILAEGKIIEGEVKHYVFRGEIKKIGYWELYDENGQLRSKQKFNGKGEEIGDWVGYYENGQLHYKGSYSHGNKTGDWIWYYKNGQLEQKGSYKEYEDEDYTFKYGFWEHYYKDGQLSKKGKYTDYGYRIGDWIWYYKNGQLEKKGSYKKYEDEDKTFEDGFWEYYYENGQLRKKGKYSNYGNKIETWVFYAENGNKTEETEYNKYGKEHGFSTSYYKNGKKKLTRIYKSGEEVGIQEQFLEDGTQTVTNGNGQYIDYHDNGQIAEKTEIKNGRRDGVSTWYYENGQEHTKMILKYDRENEKTLLWEIVSSYKKNGKKRRKGTLKNGKGTLYLYDEDGEVEKYRIKNGVRDREY